MTSEQQRQNLNRELAARLVEARATAGGFVTWENEDVHRPSQDELWDSFIDFYTRLDKHNCPKQENQEKIEWTAKSGSLPPATWKPLTPLIYGGASPSTLPPGENQ